MAFVTDSNRPQPLWQPPPTACLTAAGAVSEAPSLLMHPCPHPHAPNRSAELWTSGLGSPFSVWTVRCCRGAPTRSLRLRAFGPRPSAAGIPRSTPQGGGEVVHRNGYFVHPPRLRHSDLRGTPPPEGVPRRPPRGTVKRAYPPARSRTPRARTPPRNDACDGWHTALRPPAPPNGTTPNQKQRSLHDTRRNRETDDTVTARGIQNHFWYKKDH